MSNQDNIYLTYSDDHDRIAELLQLAEPRPEVATDRTQRVRLAVREVWRENIRARKRRLNMIRGLSALAAAAVLAVAVGIASRPVSTPLPTAPPIEVATVDAVIGETGLRFVAPEDENAMIAARERDVVRVGEVLETGSDALAALRLENGQSLRINRSTRFWFESPSTIRLERGILFFDSGHARGELSDIQIQTAIGTIYEIGTQFEVSQLESDLRVRVREGAVDLEHGDQRHRAEVGSQLLLEEGTRLSLEPVPIYGPDWDWILALSHSFELEGSSLGAFLGWVSRETGWTMQMSDGAASADATSVTLHGTIEGLRPDEALEAVLPTCDLRHTVTSGIVLIDLDS